MKIIDGLLAELEQEAATTRRVLERIPQAHLTWKPHPKSMSLGQLALHVATVPGNVAEIAAVDTVPTPPAFIQPEAASSAELVPALTESVAKAKRALGGFDDARMGAMWRLQNGGQDVMAMPRVAFVRAIMPARYPMQQDGSRRVRRVKANDAEEQYTRCHDQYVLLSFSLFLFGIYLPQPVRHVVGSAVPVLEFTKIDVPVCRLQRNACRIQIGRAHV